MEVLREEMKNGNNELTAADVLRRYKEEDQPEFSGLPLDGVNQVGNFGNYPIHVAATRGAVDELKALIDGGADVNAVGEKRMTPLHEAVGQEHLDAAHLLLASGARLTDKNEWGETALDIARRHKRDDLIELLEGAS
jgi:ankyrin repeat protein